MSNDFKRDRRRLRRRACFKGYNAGMLTHRLRLRPAGNPLPDRRRLHRHASPTTTSTRPAKASPASPSPPAADPTTRPSPPPPSRPAATPSRLAAGTYDRHRLRRRARRTRSAYAAVTIGTQNVKTDFIPDATPPGDKSRPPPPSRGPPQARRLRAYYPFTVTYADETALDPTTFDSFDIEVTGPGGYARYANFDSVDSTAPGTTAGTVNYVVKGPGGSWERATTASTRSPSAAARSTTPPATPPPPPPSAHSA